MAKETIADVISGTDINSEDAIVTLSDYLWQIGDIDTLKKELTDAAFNFQIVANVRLSGAKVRSPRGVSR